MQRHWFLLWDPLQQAVMPSLRGSFHRTLHFADGETEAQDGEVPQQQAQGRSRTGPTHQQRFSNPTIPQDVSQESFSGEARTQDFHWQRNPHRPPRLQSPTKLFSLMNLRGTFKDAFTLLGAKQPQELFCRMPYTSCFITTVKRKYLK